MTATEMEDAIRNLERQVSGIVQVLPTLATKTDLGGFAKQTDLARFATKADLERFATKADLERFATKADLERFATKDDLAEVKRHSTVLYESLRDDIRMIAEALANVIGKLDANTTSLESLTQQLQLKGVI